MSNVEFMGYSFLAAMVFGSICCGFMGKKQCDEWDKTRKSYIGKEVLYKIWETSTEHAASGYMYQIAEKYKSYTGVVKSINTRVVTFKNGKSYEFVDSTQRGSNRGRVEIVGFV